MAFVPVTSPEVATQAAISSQLFTKMRNNLDAMKGAVSLALGRRPNTIGGLTLWVEANSLNGSLADGASITSITDKSTNAYVFTPPGSGPVLKKNILNGNSVMRFSAASSQALTATITKANLYSADQCTMFIVVNETGIQGTGSIRNTLLYDLSTRVGLYGVLNWTTFVNDFLFDYAGFTGSAHMDIPADLPYFGNWHIMSADRDASQLMRVHQDNNILSTQAGTGSVTLSGTSTMGIGTDTAGDLLDGDIAEIIFYNTKLSDTDYADVYNYLAVKYGLAPQILTEGCIQFSSSSYAQVASSSSFNISGGKFTIRGWICPTANNINAGLASRSSLSSSQGDWAFGFFNGLNMQLTLRLNNNAAALQSTTTLSQNTWYFVEASYDSSLIFNNMKIFINGVLDCQGNYSTAITNNAVALNLGTYLDTSHGFAGYVSEWEFCNSVVMNTVNYVPPNVFSKDPNATCVWHITDGSGTTVADSSGGGFNLTTHGSPNWILNGRIFAPISSMTSTSALTIAAENCMQFSANSYAQVGSSSKFNINSGKFTIRGWIYPTAHISNSGLATRSSLSSSQGDWGFGIADWGTPNMVLFLHLNNAAVECRGVTPLLPNNWYFVEASYDSSLGANNMKLFINGVLDNQTTYNTAITNNAVPLTLGTYFATTTFGFPGYMSEWEFCNNVVRNTSNYTPPSTIVPDALSTCVWDINDGSGTTISDSSGNAFNLTTQGSPTWLTNRRTFLGAGTVENCLQLTGTTYCQAPSSSSFNISGGKFTIRGWVNISSFGANPIGLATRSPLGGTQGDWAVDVDNTVKKVEFRLNQAAALLQGNTVLNTNQWYFIECSYDSSLGSNNMKIFINGVLDAQSNYTTAITNTANPLVLGTFFNTSRTLTGMMSEWEFCGNFVRNTISYNPPMMIVPDANTTCAWRVNEGVGTTLADASGNGFNATITNPYNWLLNGRPYSMAVPVKNCLKLTGSSYAQVASSSTFNIAGGKFTIRGWIYPTANNTNAGLATRSSLSNSQGDWAFGFFNGSSMQLVFRLNNNAAQLVSSTLLNQNTWYFVEASYDSSLGSNNMKIFINGALDCQASYNTAITNNAVALNLGTYFDTTHGFVGYVSEWEFCNNVARNTGRYFPPLTIAPDSSSTGVWHISENVGTTLLDSSGNGFNMTTQGSPVWIKSGRTTPGAVVETIGGVPSFNGGVASSNAQSFALNDALTTFSSDVSIQGTRQNLAGNEFADQTDNADWYRLRFFITHLGLGKMSSAHNNREEG